jgi:hypothetical protein
MTKPAISRLREAIRQALLAWEPLASQVNKVVLNQFDPLDDEDFPVISVFALEETPIENDYQPRRDERRFEFDLEILVIPKENEGPEALVDYLEEQVERALTLPALKKALRDSEDLKLWKINWLGSSMVYDGEVEDMLVGVIVNYSLEYQRWPVVDDLSDFEEAKIDWTVRAGDEGLEVEDIVELET